MHSIFTIDINNNIYEGNFKNGSFEGDGSIIYENGDTYKSLKVANSDEWVDKEAAEVYHQAIGKQANIDIVTPSKGDVPLWANTEMGGLLTQFKKFGRKIEM